MFTEASLAPSVRWWSWVAVLLIFTTITLAVIVTRSPWWDEGVEADPAHNLAQTGTLGMTVLSPLGHPHVRNLVGADRYTYWNMPLYYVALGAWIKLVGFSVLSVRLLSLLLGVGLIVSVYLIASRLTRSQPAGMLAALLIATDYTVILSAATARMDMMAAACGMGGIAAYVVLRERNLRHAVLAGASLAAAACFAHPVGAIHTGGLVMTAVYLDRKRLTWMDAAAAAAPYFAFAALWGIYIAKAPDIFLAQIRAHWSYRLGGVSSPLGAIFGDLTGRYVRYFMPQRGLLEKFKVGILLVYLAGILAAALVPRIRRAPGVMLLLLLSALYYVELALVDGQRFPHYMVHVIVMWALTLAAVAACVFSEGLVPRRLLAAALGAFILLQLAGHVVKISANTYQNDYLKMIEFVQLHSTPGSLVMGPAEMEFKLAADRRLVDDARLGGLTGASPDVIVLDPFHAGPEHFAKNEPDMARHVSNVLARFHLAATFGDYRVYLPARATQESR